jgi:hypothetical protein
VRRAIRAAIGRAGFDGGLLIDPFVGSGTSILSAAERQHAFRRERPFPQKCALYRCDD